jgi:phosphatidylserine synthase 2
VLAAIGCFVLVGMLFLPDGPFIRPHPVIWRAVLALSVLYFMGLVILLHLSKEDARQLMHLIDPALGRQLPERSYAEDCRFLWQVIWPQLDIFVWAHVFGWYFKAMILRDYWLLWILSVMFEVMEYSLQHQLPNFAECWWDHWLLDVALCNALGIWAGMRTVDYFSMKTYSWRGIRDIPTVAGKVQRTVQQFTPHSFVKFDWAQTRTLRGYLVSLLVITIFLACEVNCFYLKYLLWVPPEHPLNALRILLFGLFGVVGVREAYQFFTDPACKRLGPQAWLCIASILTETLICFKFGRGEFPDPAPSTVLYFWAALLFLLLLYPIVRFGLCPPASAKPRTRSSASRSRRKIE